jgi:hypothetical protein
VPRWSRRVPRETCPIGSPRGLPPALRQVKSRARPAYRRLGQRFRALPDFVIIGAQKAGTTALIRYLQAHPDVMTEPGVYEVHYFDTQWARGTGYYRSHFPYAARVARRAAATGRPVLTGEKTPSYLFHPLAPERAASIIPHAKLIALLRDPVMRAASHHAMNKRDGIEPLELAEAVKAEEERVAASFERLAQGIEPARNPARTFSYVRRGRYAEQLDRWLRWFPRDQLLILRSEDLAASPGETYARVLDFLGLAAHRPEFARHNAAGRGGYSLAPDAQEQLERAFAEPNGQLREHYGISW